MKKPSSYSFIHWVLIISIGLLFGIPVGTGVVTFLYADGISYLSSNPRACINCHIMQDQFNSWQASSHHTVAKCNDCHSHGSNLEKYMQKGLNGFLHSAAFTTNYFHEPIRIKGFNHRIVQKNCRSCHADFIETSRTSHQSFGDHSCLNCHKNVGHRKW